MKGSCLRFHKFLREDFFKIGSIDHIIDRAGLTEAEAMEIEEKNVEQMSLYPFFSNGLNMIPGGTAGLKVIHQYAKRTGYKITRKLSADIFESEFIQIQNHMLRTIVDNKNQNIKNEKLAAMWAEDIQFRIQMMTSQMNRFSYSQIQAARVLHAADWNIEKIYEYLKKISDKNISMEQLKNLLSGKTYATIPDIIL